MNYDSATVEDERRPGRTEHVVGQEAGNQTVLLHLHDGKYFSLDTVGGRIWQLCDGRRTVSEVAAAISDEFDVDRATAASDVAELLDELERERLIEFG